MKEYYVYRGGEWIDTVSPWAWYGYYYPVKLITPNGAFVIRKK